MGDEAASIWITSAVVAGTTCYLIYCASSWLSPRYYKSYTLLSRNDQKNWDSRFPSTFHAITITALAAYSILLSDISDVCVQPEVSLLMRTSWLTNTSLGFSLGYFVVDLVLMLLHYPVMGGAEMVVHHLAAAVAVVRAALTQCAHLYTLAMLATELTTPCINARWMMDKCGLRSSRAYAANGFLLVLLWATNRVVMFVPFLAHMWVHWDDFVHLSVVDTGLVVGVPVLLLALNVWWFHKILRGAIKLARGGMKAKVKDSNDAAQNVRAGAALEGANGNGAAHNGSDVIGAHLVPARLY